MKINPLLLVQVALVLGVAAGAGGIWWVGGRDPEAIYRKAPTFQGIDVLPSAQEEEKETGAAPVDERPWRERYAALAEKKFFLPPADAVLELDTALAAGERKINTATYRLLGILIVEGGAPRATINDGQSVRTLFVGDTLAGPGEPVRIVDIRRDGVELFQPGAERTLLKVGTSIEEGTARSPWIGGTHGGAVLRVR